MARKSGVNKSEKIRELLAANADAKPSEIVKTLAEQNVKVSPQMVSTIKARLRGGKKPPKTSANGSVSDALFAVKECADKVGGFSELKRIVDTIAAVSVPF